MIAISMHTRLTKRKYIHCCQPIESERKYRWYRFGRELSIGVFIWFYVVTVGYLGYCGCRQSTDRITHFRRQNMRKCKQITYLDELQICLGLQESSLTKISLVIEWGDTSSRVHASCDTVSCIGVVIENRHRSEWKPWSILFPLYSLVRSCWWEAASFGSKWCLLHLPL